MTSPTRRNCALQHGGGRDHEEVYRAVEALAILVWRLCPTGMQELHTLISPRQSTVLDKIEGIALKCQEA